MFRDEAVAYASRLENAESHVWAGGFHGFDALFPKAALSVTARRVRTGWLARRGERRPRVRGTDRSPEVTTGRGGYPEGMDITIWTISGIGILVAIVLAVVESRNYLHRHRKQ